MYVCGTHACVAAIAAVAAAADTWYACARYAATRKPLSPEES